MAKVFDAGSTVDGSPYFAMEYVRGEPILDNVNAFNVTVSPMTVHPV